METKEMTQRVQMIRGLLGFEEVEQYKLKTVPGNSLFFWLESTADGLSFLLIKPEFFFSDYKVEIKKQDLACLCNETDDIAVYTIVTVPDDPIQMTANLMAPLLINEEKGLGLQVVLHDSPYTTRHHLFPPEKRRHCG